MCREIKRAYSSRSTVKMDETVMKCTHVSGIDLDQKRGGGTWIGAQKQGKVSALLNIMTHKSPDEGQLSRGDISHVLTL